MKCSLTIGLLAVFSAASFAQHRAGGFPLLGPSYPGVGGALPIVNPFAGNIPFAQRLGATVSAFPTYSGLSTGFGRGSGRRGGDRRQGYGGLGAYPLLYPTFGPLGFASDQPAEQPMDQSVNTAPSGQPPVVINQYYNTPPPQQGADQSAVQSYTAPTEDRPAPSEDQPLFFIALKDSSVYTAVAYWVQDGALNYVTPQGRQNQVSLSLIDRDTTDRLNRGSKFQLHLPGA